MLIGVMLIKEKTCRNCTRGRGWSNCIVHKLYEKNYYRIILMIPFVIKELSNLIVKVEIFNKMI